MRKRLDYIDRAKGILIILVVIGHIWQSGYVFDVIYAFHMPAFFVISGMLMRHTESYRRPFGKFLGERIYAYGIPFLFIEALGILTDIVRHGVTLNIKGYLYNTLTFQFNDGNLWFLVNLCLIELLVAGISRLTTSGGALWSITVVLFAARYLLPVEIPYVSTISSVCRYLLFFTAGFCGQELLTGKKNTPLTVLCGGIVLLGAAFGSRLTAGSAVEKDLLYVLTGLCGCYAVLQIARMKLPVNMGNMLAYGGRNTMIIYGTHHFYYAVLGVLLGITDYTSTPVGTGLLILLLVAALEIPTISIINNWLPFLAGRRCKRS